MEQTMSDGIHSALAGSISIAKEQKKMIKSLNHELKSSAQYFVGSPEAPLPSPRTLPPGLNRFGKWPSQGLFAVELIRSQ
jgi:hypothetical protein